MLPIPTITIHALSSSESVHAVDRRNSESTASPPFDPVICAQIVALIGHSEANTFKLSELQLIYRQLMNEQGQLDSRNTF